jgi:Tol biopolymer transport system component
MARMIVFNSKTLLDHELFAIVHRSFYCFSPNSIAQNYRFNSDVKFTITYNIQLPDKTVDDWREDGKWLVFNSSDIEETQYHITLMNWKIKESFQLTDPTYKAQLGPVFIQK